MFFLLLFFSFIIFFIGLFGFVTNKFSFFYLLLSLELVFISITLIVSVMNFSLGDFFGLTFIFFLLSIAASETALGLSIFVLYVNGTSSVSLERLILLKV